MKKIIFTLAVAMVVAGTILSPVNSSAQREPDGRMKVRVIASNFSPNNVETAELKTPVAQQDSLSDFQKFKKESNEEINNNENRIASLRADLKNEKHEARERDEKKIDALERSNRDLKKKLDDYKDNGKSDWREFKTEFKYDLEGIGHAFKDIGVRNTK
ncbi:MAG: hypothetical protein JJE25_10505 [Bacteroidia bacterium]|nr:hypothetical protein [Bacteroidia bacterium]